MNSPKRLAFKQQLSQANTGFALRFTITLGLLFTLNSVKAQQQLQNEAEQAEAEANVGQMPIPVLWLAPHQVAQKPDIDAINGIFAGGYALNDQGALRASIKQGYTPAARQTIALVLVPQFEKATGAAFLHMGNIAIFDDHSRNGQTTEAHTFKKGQPVILVFRSTQRTAYGRAANSGLHFVDTSLFGVAEVWVANQLLTDDQTRHLETYLALKYAVNISQNKKERYRNYFTAEEHQQWHSSTEGRYSQHILGLGRMDAFGWQQTQTQTNPEVTGLAFTIALDEVMPRGEMKEVELADNSYLVFSKARDYDHSLCPSPRRQLPFYGWKMKRSNWQSSAKYVQCIAATPNSSIIGAKTDTVLLTDGRVKYYLPIQHHHKSMQITLPLALLADGTNYFLLPTQSNPLCEEKIKIAVDSLKNAIGIAVSAENLPLSLHVNGLSDLSTNTYILTDPYNIILTTNPGKYQLDFYTENGSLGYSTTVSVSGSPSGNASQTGYGQLNQVPNPMLKQGIIANADAARLLAYPNPSAENEGITLQLLNATTGEYTIRVVDQGGKLLYTNKHYFDAENATWQYTFSSPGAYTVVYTLGEETHSQTIIIQ